MDYNPHNSVSPSCGWALQDPGARRTPCPIPSLSFPLAAFDQRRRYLAERSKLLYPVGLVPCEASEHWCS